MSRYVINGGEQLEGEIVISGAKNAVLPILAATVLNRGTSILHRCPKIEDVFTMIEILETVGATVKWEDHTLVVNTSSIQSTDIPEDLVKKMRSSIILMGSFLGRYKEVGISYPGGCSLGSRPIDLHLKGLRAMGAVFDEAHGNIRGKIEGTLQGTHIFLDFPSVGATQNILLGAVLAEGVTVIHNAAMEPEIEDLQNFLNTMGARVKGSGTATIIIEGVKTLSDVEYTVMGDRIEAGTFLVAGAITKGNIIIHQAPVQTMSFINNVLRKTGCSIQQYEDILQLKSPRILKSIDRIITRPYPGFPTDMQPQIMSLLTLAKGTSMIKETVFSSRFKHGEELIRMGADIQFSGDIAMIKGKSNLTGAQVYAYDLRGGAALILAGLSAYGETTVLDGKFIERGYESIEDKLKIVGAKIERIE